MEEPVTDLLQPFIQHFLVVWESCNGAQSEMRGSWALGERGEECTDSIYQRPHAWSHESEEGNKLSCVQTLGKASEVWYVSWFWKGGGRWREGTAGGKGGPGGKFGAETERSSNWNWVPLKLSSSAKLTVNLGYPKFHPFLVLHLLPFQIEEYQRKGGIITKQDPMGPSWEDPPTHTTCPLPAS